MTISEILNTVSIEGRSTFSKLQKVNRKICKAKNAILFNDICLQENILPKYTNIKLHDQRAKKQLFTEEFQRKLVIHQLETKKKLVEKLVKKKESLHEKLSNSNIEHGNLRQLLTYLDEKTENFEHFEKVKAKIWGTSHFFGGC